MKCIGFEIRQAVEAVEITVEVALRLSKKAQARYDHAGLKRLVVSINNGTHSMTRAINRQSSVDLEFEVDMMTSMLSELRTKVAGLARWTREGSHAWRLARSVIRQCQALENLAKAVLLPKERDDG